MLNKDEYNEDEYNDYYAQETRGAEILGKKDDSGGGKKIFLIILLLAVIGVGGYFGFQNIASLNIFKQKDKIKSDNRDDNSSLDKNLSKIENNLSKILKSEEILKGVEASLSSNSSNGKINPEDIASIVQMVMKKMSVDANASDRNETAEHIDKPKLMIGKKEIKDTKLIESLKNREADSLVSQLDKVDVNAENDKSQKATEKGSGSNTYNKIVVKKEIVTENDELSRLSDEITNVIEDGEKDNSSDYVKGVEKEVKTRKKEMRYITVKKGDTLAKIAKRVYGNVMDYKKIYEANPDILSRPDRISIGQRLRVPE
jgi:LysM repeat protein